MNNTIIHGDALSVLKSMPDDIVDCVVTSPPYWGLRNYGVVSQIGHEKTPEEYIEKMTYIFKEIKRILKSTGTIWINIGDSYYNNFGGGSKTCGVGNIKALRERGRANKQKHPLIKFKDIVGIPWMLAFALRNDGWYLRQDIIWHKSNAMPESVHDRCTKSHEYIFLMTKNPKYYFDQDSIREPLNLSSFVEGRAVNTNGPTDMKRFCHPKGRNKRSVWTVPTASVYGQEHPATYPEKLILPCILAGCPRGGVVLDPFFGSGTTGFVASNNGRDYIGIEINEKYIEIAKERLGLFRKPEEKIA